MALAIRRYFLYAHGLLTQFREADSDNPRHSASDHQEESYVIKI
jgi:hypothetical protein